VGFKGLKEVIRMMRNLTMYANVVGVMLAYLAAVAILLTPILVV